MFEANPLLAKTGKYYLKWSVFLLVLSQGSSLNKNADWSLPLGS